jgi:DNA-directed RNA polymerase sigma subunit (sigma70/sigma32)
MTTEAARGASTEVAAMVLGHELRRLGRRQPLDANEISNLLGISRQHVRVVEQRALEKLRTAAAGDW